MQEVVYPLVNDEISNGRVGGQACNQSDFHADWLVFHLHTTLILVINFKLIDGWIGSQFFMFVLRQ